MRVIEVFADVGCPFTHVGLRRFVAARDAAGRDDVALWVRPWPLEIVNGQPLDPHFIAEEVDDIREQVAPDLFVGFREDRFPSTSLPALSLAAAAYDLDPAVGERVSLALRTLLFEEGVDVADGSVLDALAAEHEVAWMPGDDTAVLAEHQAGVERGVVGSPHFFTPEGGFFCPSLDISRDDGGHLHIAPKADGFESFLEACFG